MSEKEGVTEAFSAARANVRETIKWLLAAFGGLAVIVVGTSPLADLGALDAERLQLALLCGALGLGAVFWAIAISVRLLVTPAFFLSDITRDDRLERFVDANAHDLLPVGIATVTELFGRREAIFQSLVQISLQTDERKAKQHDTADLEALQKGLQANLAVVERVTGRLIAVCNYERLRCDFEEAKRELLILAVSGVVLLIMFAVAVNPPKPPAAPPAVKVECGCGVPAP